MNGCRVTQVHACTRVRWGLAFYRFCVQPWQACSSIKFLTGFNLLTACTRWPLNLSILSEAQVHKVSWWMCKFDGFTRTPKRHYGYSNAAAISQLDDGPLVGWNEHVKNRPNHIKTCGTYFDKAGNKRYKGNPNLKRSELCPQLSS